MALDGQSPTARPWSARPPAPFAAESPDASRCRWDPAHWSADAPDNLTPSYLAPATPPAAAHTALASAGHADASALHSSPARSARSDRSLSLPSARPAAWVTTHSARARWPRPASPPAPSGVHPPASPLQRWLAPTPPATSQHSTAASLSPFAWFVSHSFLDSITSSLEFCAYKSAYTLPAPWYGDTIVTLADTVVLQHRMKTSPAPFARRNVFCGNRLYQNKYEMNEWLQEAHSKGMSNPREIWRYARQKETALHGA